MASYVVMEPSRGSADDARLVRDGFHLLAFLMPVVWMLWHRLWIEAALALAASVAIAALGALAGFGEAAPFLSLIVSIYVGLEAPRLLAGALERRGWREWGVVEAADEDDAWTRYAAEAVSSGHHPVPAMENPRGAAPRSEPPALGLLSYPGGR